ISALWPVGPSGSAAPRPYVVVRSPQETVVGPRALMGPRTSPLGRLLNKLARLSADWEGVTGEFPVSRGALTSLDVKFSRAGRLAPAPDGQRVGLSAQFLAPNDAGAVVRSFVLSPSAKPGPITPGSSTRPKPGA